MLKKFPLFNLLLLLCCCSNAEGVPETRSARSASTAATNQAPGDNRGSALNVRDYGALCDGVTNDTAAILSADRAASAVNGSIYLPPSASGCVVASLTLTVPVLTDGGSFRGTNGETLTITKGISNPTNAILFRNFLPGQAKLALNASITAYPEWWGGRPDGVTPNQAFITAALNSGGKHVVLSSGEWLITAPIVMHDVFVTLSGTSRVNTYLIAGANVSSMIKFSNTETYAGGWVIENIRFHGFPQTGATFTGYALDATDHTLIDSVVRNCWFGLSSAAAGAFNGKAVDLLWESNGLELGVNTLHFTLASMVRIHGNVFWECYQNIIDLDGVPGSINEVSVTDNIIDFHHLGIGIRVRNGKNVVINGLIYSPNDTVPSGDLTNYFPTVIDLDNADVVVSNIRVAGCLAYTDADKSHTGKAYVKIKQFMRTTNSSVRVTNVKATLTSYAFYATGSMTLSGSDLTFENQSVDAIFMESVSGMISLDNIQVNQPTGAFIKQVGTMTADTFIRSSEFYDARSSGEPDPAFLFNTTGNFVFSGNSVVQDRGASRVTSLFDATLVDGKAFFDNNVYAVPTVVIGSLFKAGSRGVREAANQGSGIRGVYYDLRSLPVFANNRAAIAGGLRPGAFYRTGGDPDALCVVH